MLEPCKKSVENFIAKRKVTSCNIKSVDRLWKKIYMLYSFNFAWYGALLPALKGNNYYNTLESSWKCTNDLFL